MHSRILIVLDVFVGKINEADFMQKKERKRGSVSVPFIHYYTVQVRFLYSIVRVCARLHTALGAKWRASTPFVMPIIAAHVIAIA